MHKVANVVLRSASAGDAEFVYGVIEATMRDYVVAIWGHWNEAAVLEEAQAICRAGQAQIIQVDGAAVGMLLVERHATHIELEQLLVLPAHQNRGVGTLLVRGLMSEALHNKLPLRLRVLAPNPAKRFYEQLGFVVVDTTAERFFMEYCPRDCRPSRGPST